MSGLSIMKLAATRVTVCLDLPRAIFLVGFLGSLSDIRTPKSPNLERTPNRALCRLLRALDFKVVREITAVEIRAGGRTWLPFYASSRSPF